MTDHNVLSAIGGRIGAVCLGGAIGGLCFASVRYCNRVESARRRLQALLSTAAGGHARIVITGATSGIGEELARQFARHPSVSLLLGCRDAKRAARLFEQGHGGSNADGPRIVPLELLDLDSVQTFVEEAHEFLSHGEDGLRLLINNAGVMKPPPPLKPTIAEPTWQTNYLGPFLLTELLAKHREKVKKTTPLRVVHVSSRLERRSKLDEALLADVDRGQAGPSAYGDAKRALMLWTSVRAQAFAFKSDMYVHAATPGMVDTQLGRHTINPWLWPLTKPLRMLLLRSSAEGALGVAAAGLRPEATQKFGRYLDGENELEDLVMERMGEKAFAQKVVQWAGRKSALDARAQGYDR